jgi:hypothetical protein
MGRVFVGLASNVRVGSKATLIGQVSSVRFTPSSGSRRLDVQAGHKRTSLKRCGKKAFGYLKLIPTAE